MHKKVKVELKESHVRAALAACGTAVPLGDFIEKAIEAAVGLKPQTPVRHAPKPRRTYKRKLLNQNEITECKRLYAECGMPLTHIAKRFGVSANQVKARIGLDSHQHRILLSEDEIAIAVQKKKEGYSMAHISALIGKSAPTIYAAMKASRQ